MASADIIVMEGEGTERVTTNLELSVIVFPSSEYVTLIYHLWSIELTYMGCGEAGVDVQVSNIDWVMR